jgi:hypothetical protein
MSDKLTVTVNDKTKHLVMSFGLLNEIAKLVGDIDNLGNIIIDPHLREAILVALLSDRDAEGVITTKYNTVTADLTIDEFTKIADWVSDVLFTFFIRLLESAKALQEKNQERVFKLTPTSTGLAS